MSGGEFTVDTATLRQFRAVTDGARARTAGLHGNVGAAALTPGTFTRTSAGQEADAAHAGMLQGLGRCIDKADKLLQGHSDRVGTSADNYETTDGKHQAAMSGVQGQIDDVKGFRL